jgi:hypothetical protein
VLKADVDNQTQRQDFEWLINNTLAKMRDAEAFRDWYKYFVYFKFVYYRLLCYIPPDERQAHESDWKKFYAARDKIEKENTNETAKNKELDLLMKNFVETHDAVLFLTFPRAKLAFVKEDSVIDLDKTDLRTIQNVVRASSTGAPTAITNAMEGQAAREEKQNGKTEGGEGDGVS